MFHLSGPWQSWKGHRSTRLPFRLTLIFKRFFIISAVNGLPGCFDLSRYTVMLLLKRTQHYLPRSNNCSAIQVFWMHAHSKISFVKNNDNKSEHNHNGLGNLESDTWIKTQWDIRLLLEVLFPEDNKFIPHFYLLLRVLCFIFDWNFIRGEI